MGDAVESEVRPTWEGFEHILEKDGYLLTAGNIGGCAQLSRKTTRLNCPYETRLLPYIRLLQNPGKCVPIAHMACELQLTKSHQSVQSLHQYIRRKSNGHVHSFFSTPNQESISASHAISAHNDTGVMINILHLPKAVQQIEPYYECNGRVNMVFTIVNGKPIGLLTLYGLTNSSPAAKDMKDAERDQAQKDYADAKNHLVASAKDAVKEAIARGAEIIVYTDCNDARNPEDRYHVPSGVPCNIQQNRKGARLIDALDELGLVDLWPEKMGLYKGVLLIKWKTVRLLAVTESIVFICQKG
jgi:hypothetical protein